MRRLVFFPVMSRAASTAARHVFSPDLFAHQEIVDRRAALACVQDLLNGMRAPQADDAAVPEAMLSPPTADAIVRRIRHGDRLTVFAGQEFDQTALSEEPFLGLFAAAAARGAEVRLALKRTTFDALNFAQRLGLRDTALRYGLELYLVRRLQRRMARRSWRQSMPVRLHQHGSLVTWRQRLSPGHGVSAVRLPSFAAYSTGA